MFNRDDAFEVIEADAHSVGYSMTLGWDENVPYMAFTSSDPLNPTITCETEMFEDNTGYTVYCFKLELSFPILSCPSDLLEYNDSFEYVAGKWKDIAKFCTNVIQFTYDDRRYDE